MQQRLPKAQNHRKSSFYTKGTVLLVLVLGPRTWETGFRAKAHVEGAEVPVHGQAIQAQAQDTILLPKSYNLAEGVGGPHRTVSVGASV